MPIQKTDTQMPRRSQRDCSAKIEPALRKDSFSLHKEVETKTVRTQRVVSRCWWLRRATGLHDVCDIELFVNIPS